MDHITFPEALQVLHDLQRVAGVLAAHKGQHCHRICCARLYGWHLPRDAGGLQQTSALLQEPAASVISFCTASTTSSYPADTKIELVDAAGGEPEHESVEINATVWYMQATCTGYLRVWADLSLSSPAPSVTDNKPKHRAARQASAAPP